MYPSSSQSPYPSAAGPSAYPPATGGRRAPSRTLPIIVGFGVAVGVFGGLMIIRGTGNSSAAGTEPEVLEGTTKTGDTEEVPVLGPPDAGAAEVAATVTIDAAPAQNTPPEPEKRTVTLRFEVTPDDAKIKVDGKTVRDDALPIELAADEKKTVEIVVAADGYEAWTKKVDLSTTDDEQSVSVELEKIVKKSAGGRRPRPRGDDRKRDPQRRPGGIIDL
jgi:hypothetical protein